MMGAESGGYGGRMSRDTKDVERPFILYLD